MFRDYFVFKLNDLFNLFLVLFAIIVFDIHMIYTVYLPRDFVGVNLYHIQLAVIVNCIIIILIIVFRSVIYALLDVLCFCGIEDTGYYLFERGYLPEKFWGVTIGFVFEPLKSYIIQLNIIGFSITFLILFFMSFENGDSSYRWMKRRLLT